MCRLGERVSPRQQSVDVLCVFRLLLASDANPASTAALKAFAWARCATTRWLCLLDADILGLDPVRLPSDGRVPVFKAGRVVVVPNTKNSPTDREQQPDGELRPHALARIRVFGSDGLEISSRFARTWTQGPSRSPTSRA